MSCPFCGVEIRSNALFCHRCGRKLPAAVAGDEAAPPDALPDNLAEIIAAETQEYTLSALQPDEAAPLLPPLLPEALIAGRYAVASLVAATPDANFYEAIDRLAQSACWECGRSYPADETDHYCPHCGAERRETRLRVREQRLTMARFADQQAQRDGAIIEVDRVYTILGDVAPDEAPPVPAAPSAHPTTPKPARAAAIPPALPPATAPAATLEAAPAVAPEAAPVPSALPAAEPPAAPFVALTDALSPEQSTSQLPALPASLAAGAVAPPPFALAVNQNDAPTIEADVFAPPVARAPSRLRMVVGMASDAGRARRHKPNEDTALVLTLEHAGDRAPAPLTLCVVADGLGGHENGQRAGRLAARIIAANVVQALWLPALEGQFAPEFDPVQLGEALRAGIQDANARIVATNAIEHGDMGCTVTAFLAQGDAACIANVGDSRTYHFNGRDLSKATIDHSLVARLVAARMLEPAEVYTHPQRSQIFRSLGDETNLPVDLFPRRLECGDAFLLCSDGLWEMVRDPDLAALLAGGLADDPADLARSCVDTANDHGGEDNITAIIARVVAG